LSQLRVLLHLSRAPFLDDRVEVRIRVWAKVRVEIRVKVNGRVRVRVWVRN
jgi:hypothetical protein